MKIKYSFKNVSSNSSTIKVMANDVTVLTLNKADCTSSDSEVAYDRLNSGELGPYYLEDIDCNDLSTLTITGAEQHAATYTSETNTEWKEYAHNKIGSKHFNDSKWIASCDANTSIVVYNQGSTPTTYSNFTSFISSIPTTFATEYTLDLSNIDASKVSDNLSYTYWWFNASPLNSLSSKLAYSYKLPNLTDMEYMFFNFTKLKKSPKIPDSVINMYYAFAGCTSLTDVSEISDSVTNMNQTFTGCTSLTDVSEIPDSVTNMNQTFSGCTSLTKLPKLPSGTIDMYQAFSGCTGIKDIDVLDIRSIYRTVQMFSDCSFDNINNLVLTGGNLYSFLINKCKHLGVVTTNTLNTYVITSSSFAGTPMNYIYYYQNGSDCCPIFSNWPNQIDAFSSCIKNVLYKPDYSLPTSSGYNYWIDYIYSDTEAVHQITQRIINISKHFDTLEATATFKTDAFELLLVNPDYVDSEKEGHTFELKNFTIVSQTPSSYVNSSNAAVSVDSDDASKCIISLDCKNIKDDSVSSVSVVVKADYNAVIDGYAFLGETQVTVKVSFDFELTEEMEVETEIDKSDTTSNA